MSKEEKKYEKKVAEKWLEMGVVEEKMCEGEEVPREEGGKNGTGRI